MSDILLATFGVYPDILFPLSYRKWTPHLIHHSPNHQFARQTLNRLRARILISPRFRNQRRFHSVDP
jgi:hypothetical protein